MRWGRYPSRNLPTNSAEEATKFPDKPIIIAGDDDPHVEKIQGVNPGRTKAEEAANAVSGKAIFPIFAPNEQATEPKHFTDFNDLATRSVLGMESVIRQVKTRVLKETEKLAEFVQTEKQPGVRLGRLK